MPWIVLALISTPVAHAGVRADFDGDGRGDLAIGAPLESVGSAPGTLFQAGAVHILYGARHRLGLAGDQLLTEDTSGIEGDGANPGAWFGDRFAVGDFDGDGYGDLAIGAPFKYLPGGYEMGAVHILYGSRRGLTLRGDQYLTENSPGIKGDGARSEDTFGFGLAAGDFNRDGRDDLAIGAPNKDVASQDSDDGAVHVLYGGRRQLRVRRDQYLTAKNLGYATHLTAGGGFGTALAAGDLNGDRRADLVVGSPGEQVGNDHNAGAVRVLFGGADRLRRRGVRLFTEDSKRMAGPSADSFDEFGNSFAIGRFNSGWRGDLAIGVPDASDQRGAVHVLYGRRRGPSLRRDQYLTTRTPGINGRGWAFGYALAAGNLNGDRHHELAIGAPPGNNGGAVHILYGARRHLRVRSDQLLTQATPGLAGDEIRADEQFGFALGVANFNGDRPSDLAIGEPQDFYDPQHGQCLTPGGGGVHVLYGARKRLSLKGDHFLTQDTPGIAGDGSEPCDAFGKALVNPFG
ncbi:MAG: FG-GAP repeat protein [Actinomycetota bacterium]